MVQDSGMANYIPFDLNQSYLLPPDLKEWAPNDDVAHCQIASNRDPHFASNHDPFRGVMGLSP
jgi:hypothetical protein